MGYGEHDEMVLGAIVRAPERASLWTLSLQWVKASFASKSSAPLHVEPDYKNQPKASDLQAAIPYVSTDLMSGHVAIPEELQEAFYAHAKLTAKVRDHSDCFRGENPHSIWENMTPNTPRHE